MTRWSLLLLLALPASLFAQAERPLLEDDPFGEVVDVRVVNVEVVVEDRSGNRVQGLDPSDFVLFVDGKPRRIEYFTEVADRASVSSESTSSARPATDEVLVPTSFVLYVDDQHAIKAHRNQILARLEQQIASLAEHDSMAIVANSGRKLDVLAELTSSKDTLRTALREAMQRDTRGAHQLALKRRMDEASPALGNLMADERRRLLERAISGAVSTMRNYADAPGRKVMLLLAGDWPSGAFEIAAGFNTSTTSDLLISAPLAKTANLLGFTLYPVDVKATMLESGDTARWRNFRRLAIQTGGRAIGLGERRNALESVLDDTSSYYWLGFTTSRTGTDLDHRIDVGVKGKNLVVRNRREYRDLSRRTEVSIAAQSRLLFGDAAKEVQLRVDLGKARRTGFLKVKLPVTIHIPVHDLTVLPHAGQQIAQAELHFAAVGDGGELPADVPVLPVRLQLDEVPEEPLIVPYRTEIKLRRMPHDLLVAVHDPATGKTMTGRARFHPKGEATVGGSP